MIYPDESKGLLRVQTQDRRCTDNILMAHLDESYPEDVTYKTIEWGVAGWVGHETGSTDRGYLDEFDTEYFEVVGNIFDNKEIIQERYK